MDSDQVMHELTMHNRDGHDLGRVRALEETVNDLTRQVDLLQQQLFAVMQTVEDGA